MTGSGGGGGGGYGITISPSSKLSYFYALALLNSKLLDWLLKGSSSYFRGGYFAYNRQYIENLPIRGIDFDRGTDKKVHDRLAHLARRMLDLHASLDSAQGHDHTLLQRQIEATDREIDNLVYELYGLTDEEIKIVEDATA